MEMTLNTRCQLTFTKSLLEHLGVKAGEKVAIKKLPGGKIEIEARKNKMPPEMLLTALRSIVKTEIQLSTKEINEIIEQSYVNAGLGGGE